MITCSQCKFWNMSFTKMYGSCGHEKASKLNPDKHPEKFDKDGFFLRSKTFLTVGKSFGCIFGEVGKHEEETL